MSLEVTILPSFLCAAGESKIQALLHGHSYTAHPLGCSTALEALRLYEIPSLNPNFCAPPSPSGTPAGASATAAAGHAQQAQQGRTCQKQGAPGCGVEGGGGDGGGGGACEGPCGRMLPLWDEARARELSRHPRVQAVVALGEAGSAPARALALPP
jgi:dethiobiotin synthetase/adenosylmethionine--8-amino-7-oxononanoate aminotransferase